MRKWIHGAFVVVTLFAAMPAIPAQQAMIKKYTINDGLVMNRVRGFHQDVEGFIWIYTWDGLSRFEGYRFRNYVTGKELNHSMINDMVDNPDGSINLALNDGTLDVIKESEIQADARKKGIIINVFFKDKRGKTLTGTDFYGICLFENGQIKPVSDLPTTIAIHTAAVKSNTLFMASVNDLIVAKLVYEKNSLKKIHTIQHWDYGFDHVKSIYLDSNEDVFVCTRNGLMQLLPDPDSLGKYELVLPGFVDPNAPWKNWPALSMIQSDDGTYWIGTENGLIHVKNIHEWDVITTYDNLPSNSINALFIDRNNILWIGTDLGVGSLNLATRIERRSRPNCSYVNFLYPDSHKGIYGICESQYVYSLDPVDSVFNETLFAFEILPYQESLYLIHGAGIKRMQAFKPDPRIQYIASSRNGTIFNDRIYIQHYGGQYRCQADNNCSKVSGIDFRAEAICTKGEKLLIGTWNDGLQVAELDPNDTLALTIVSNLNKWLPGKEIRSLMVSRSGDIWVGTRYHGVTRLICDPGLNDCQVQVYSMNNGLIGNWVTCTAEDNWGNIWVGSKSGIDKLIPESDGYRVFSFSRVFGYYDVINHLAVAADNTIWAGTSSGFTRITDGNIDSLSAPQTYITEIIAGGNDQGTSGNALTRLAHNKNNVKFAFSAPDFINEKQIQFSYRLLGSPKTQWSTPATIHEIFFSNLKPGDYTFQVAALGWNGKIGNPASQSFTIIAPFWQQWWFVVLLILLIANILYALYRFRIAQIQRVQSMRERIASDLHDEIGSSLSHVNILTEIGKQSIAQPEKSVEILQRIGSEVQNSSEALDDIIWSVKTRWDEIGDVVARMRQYATEIFEPIGISFIITEEISADPHPDMEFRRDLFLVYKEILRNIIRHADAKRVDIDIRIESKMVKLTITDDGKGFLIDQPTQRSGLSNIRRRVGNWKGRADWISTPGTGTTVIVVMRPG